MRNDPHLLVEGCLIAGFAMRAHAAYIYIRGEFIREREALQAAIDEAYDAKLIGKNNIHGWDFDLYRPSRRRRLYLRRGNGAARKPRRQEGHAAAEAAIPGQCRALWLPQPPSTMSNSIAVAPDHPSPRRRPGSPRIGRPNNTGTKLFCLSGHVNKPCNVEEEMGIPLRELIDKHCGRRARRLGQSAGGDPGRLVRAVHPGKPVQRPAHGFRQPEGSAVRARHGGRHRDGQVDRCDPGDRAALPISTSMRVCGQCTPCREGTGWMWRVLDPHGERPTPRSARSTCCWK